MKCYVYGCENDVYDEYSIVCLSHLGKICNYQYCNLYTTDEKLLCDNHFNMNCENCKENEFLYNPFCTKCSECILLCKKCYNNFNFHDCKDCENI